MTYPVSADRPGRLHPAPAILSAVVAALLYAVTLGGTYVYDDLPIVVNDPRVRHIDQSPQIWVTQYFPAGLDNLYRPLVSTSYAVEWFLYGDRPWAFHLVNVLLHAATAAAVARLTQRISKHEDGDWRTEDRPTDSIHPPSSILDPRLLPPLLAGLLFAALPIHVEAVANLVGRAELGCGLFSVLSLTLIAGRPPAVGRYVAAGCCGFAALLCKEQAIVLPVLWFLLRPVPRNDRDRAVLKWSAFAVCWVWAPYLVLREHFLKFEWDRSFLDYSMQPMIASTGVDRWLLPVALLGRYAAMIVAPLHLSPDYGADVIGPHVHWNDPYFWIGWGVLIGAIVLMLSTRRRGVRFCVIAAGLTSIVVVNGFVITGVIFAERLMYLPTAFVAVCVGLIGAGDRPRKSLGAGAREADRRGLFAARVFNPCFDRSMSLRGSNTGHKPVPRDDRHWLRQAAIPASRLILLVVLGLYGVRTVTAARLWNRPRDLFADATSHHPESIQLYLSMAQEDSAAGRLDAVEDDLAHVCDRYPRYVRAWILRGENAIDSGRFDLARNCLLRARSLGSTTAVAADLGRLADAEAARSRQSNGGSGNNPRLNVPGD